MDITFNFSTFTFQVQTTHIFRTYRIIGLSMYGADRQTFPWKNCITDKIEQRTVQDYFKKEYKKVIQHPSIICVQAHPEEKNIYLPMEVYISYLMLSWSVPNYPWLFHIYEHVIKEKKTLF